MLSTGFTNYSYFKTLSYISTVDFCHQHIHQHNHTRSTDTSTAVDEGRHAWIIPLSKRPYVCQEICSRKQLTSQKHPRELGLIVNATLTNISSEQTDKQIHCTCSIHTYSERVADLQECHSLASQYTANVLSLSLAHSVCAGAGILG